jgi:hypothetical protein
MANLRGTNIFSVLDGRDKEIHAKGAKQRAKEEEALAPWVRLKTLHIFSDAEWRAAMTEREYRDRFSVWIEIIDGPDFQLKEEATPPPLKKDAVFVDSRGDTADTGEFKNDFVDWTFPPSPSDITPETLK